MGDDSNGLVPVDKSKLTLSSAKVTAAGIPAVISSAVHSMKKMGVGKTVKTLRMVNQKEGFDCPGCAWPDPDHRSSFEFCENGAKAVADEAMKANVNAEFFARYSISELSTKSDYWLNSQGRIAEPMYASREDSHYQPISWESALAKISDKLKSCSRLTMLHFTHLVGLVMRRLFVSGICKDVWDK